MPMDDSVGAPPASSPVVYRAIGGRRKAMETATYVYRDSRSFLGSLGMIVAVLAFWASTGATHP